MDEGPLADLTQAQKTAVALKVKLERKSAAEEAVQDTKSKVKTAMLGCLKPTGFCSDTMSIAKYIARWEPFRASMGFDDETAIASFLTFMDTKAGEKIDRIAQETWKITNQEGVEEEVPLPWEEFKKRVIGALSPRAASLEARYKLKYLKQRDTDYGQD